MAVSASTQHDNARLRQLCRVLSGSTFYARDYPTRFLVWGQETYRLGTESRVLLHHAMTPSSDPDRPGDIPDGSPTRLADVNSTMPMGLRPKFKLDEQPPGTVTNQSSDLGVGVLRRVMPTAETQAIYNEWREEQERTTYGLSRDGMRNGQISPLAAAQPTSTLPAPFLESTTHSVARALDDMGVEGPRPKYKGRPGRQPLPKVSKLRAALLRKIRACDDCRERRVRVSGLRWPQISLMFVLRY